MKPPKDNSATELSQNISVEEEIEAFKKFRENGEQGMSTKWRKQTFQSLKEFSENSESKPGSSPEVLALKGRYEDIMYMVERDGIWPPTVSPERDRFCAALCEVLSRLPQETFDKVEDEVRFVLDDPSLKMLAVNAPAPPSSDLSGKSGIDTIVFFRACMDLAPKALIGLIAHEIAHTSIHGKDYRKDEILVNERARKWGFGPELDCLKSEKERCLSTSLDQLGRQSN
jgi:hypothetical protein